MVEERQALQQMLLGKLIFAHRKLNVDPNINSKWIKELNIRPETVKLVLERAGNTLELIGIGKDFLNRTQKAQQVGEMIDK
jgi:hypothetical protein